MEWRCSEYKLCSKNHAQTPPRPVMTGAPSSLAGQGQSRAQSTPYSLVAPRALPAAKTIPIGPPSTAREVAQPGSASHWGCGGRRFESCRPDQWKFPFSARTPPLSGRGAAGGGARRRLAGSMGSTNSPRSTPRMKSRQIRAGSPPPLLPGTGALSSRPTHTAVTRSPAKPMNSASRPSCEVPVLPKVGVPSAAARPVPLFAACHSRSSIGAHSLSGSSARPGRRRRPSTPCTFTG